MMTIFTTYTTLRGPWGPVSSIFLQFDGYCNSPCRIDVSTAAVIVLLLFLFIHICFYISVVVVVVAVVVVVVVVVDSAVLKIHRRIYFSHLILAAFCPFY